MYVYSYVNIDISNYNCMYIQFRLVLLNIFIMGKKLMLLNAIKKYNKRVSF